MKTVSAALGALFGGIADYFGKLYSPAMGFRISFAVSGILIFAGIVLAGWRLPNQPRGKEEPDMQEQEIAARNPETAVKVLQTGIKKPDTGFHEP